MAAHLIPADIKRKASNEAR